MYIKSRSLQIFSLREWSVPQRNFSPSRRWQPKAGASRRLPRRLGCLSERRSGGCSSCAPRARRYLTTLGDHAARRPVCVSSSYVLCPSLDMRVMCTFFNGSSDKIRSAFVRITNQRMTCSHTVLHSRQCSQTSSGIWHRARPQHRPGAHECGALASEAGHVWVKW